MTVKTTPTIEYRDWNGQIQVLDRRKPGDRHAHYTSNGQRMMLKMIGRHFELSVPHRKTRTLRRDITFTGRANAHYRARLDERGRGFQVWPVK